MDNTGSEVVPQLAASVNRMPSREYLHECFTYNPETGDLIWKERPRSHFKSNKGHSVFNSRFLGRKAACPHSQGYSCVRMTINGKCLLFFVHRIVVIMNGIEIPHGKMVDHINGIRTDNRIGNLRIADMHQNACNSSLTGGRKPKNGNLPRGVTPSSSNGKFTARIRHRNKVLRLGVFETPESAKKAYDAKAIELRGEFVKVG